MKVEEHVLLAPLTTLGVGGAARFFVEAHSEKDVREAVVFARARGLPLYTLGGGSNVLVPDTGVEGVVVKMATSDVVFEEVADDVLIIAEAGATWNGVVDSAGARGLFGIENLAGIPGTIGGAAVQNIGAYGMELSTVFAYADTIDAASGVSRRVAREEAEFGYRTSLFKKWRSRIVTRVALRLPKRGVPNLSYPDLVCARAEGVSPQTPAEIARAVRAIRWKKFPKNEGEGTAGSFFKNPIISPELADALKSRFREIPLFPQPDGSMKMSLAWILDHGLSLKGFSKGAARLYEKHSLVIVAREGARAEEVDALACEVSERVFAETGVSIEREVETFGTH